MVYCAGLVPRASGRYAGFAGGVYGLGQQRGHCERIVAKVLGRHGLHLRGSDRAQAGDKALVAVQRRAIDPVDAQGLGLDAAPLFEAARQGLVSGTHAAFLLCAVIAGLSVLVSWRLPHYTIRPQAVPVAADG